MKHILILVMAVFLLPSVVIGEIWFGLGNQMPHVIIGNCNHRLDFLIFRLKDAGIA